MTSCRLRLALLGEPVLTPHSVTPQASKLSDLLRMGIRQPSVEKCLQPVPNSALKMPASTTARNHRLESIDSTFSLTRRLGVDCVNNLCSL